MESKKLGEALKYASENRKFEIDLYWKRASYFWTLIAAAFVGFFATQNSEHMGDNRDLFALLIAVIGCVFTFAWSLTSRGSKMWQENWENHVELLEDAVIGPLHKTTLARPRSHHIFIILPDRKHSQFPRFIK